MTRPPRNNLRTRFATSHASYSSLRGRHPAWQTARPSRSNSVSPGKRARSYPVKRAREDGKNVTHLSCHFACEGNGVDGGNGNNTGTQRNGDAPVNALSSVSPRLCVEALPS